MDNFLKWSAFFISLFLVGLVWYDVNENRKLREMLGVTKKECQCDDHGQDGNGSFENPIDTGMN